jgi:hypothetical protein
MTRAKVGAIVTLLLGMAMFCYAQQSGQDSDQPAQEPNKPHEVPPPPRQPEVTPPQGQQEAKPPKQMPEAKPPKNEKQEMPRQNEEPKSAEQQKPNEQQKPAHEQSGASNRAKAKPAGKSAHIPDPQFKANFGRPHTFTVNRVITTTRVIPNQTQFVFAGYTFVFLDPWPADWLFTDDCFIDFVDDQYFLFDVLHPGIRVALFVVG